MYHNLKFWLYCIRLSGLNIYNNLSSKSITIYLSKFGLLLRSYKILYIRKTNMIRQQLWTITYFKKIGKEKSNVEALLIPIIYHWNKMNIHSYYSNIGIYEKNWILFIQLQNGESATTTSISFRFSTFSDNLLLENKR